MRTLRLSFFIFFSLILTLHPAAAQVVITEINQMTFAKVARPTSGSQNLTISPTNGAVSGSGTVLIGTPERGEYRLRRIGGLFSRSCTIDIQDVTSGSSALTVSNFKGYYDGGNINSFPKSGLDLPSFGSSGTILYLGATATYNSSVPAGNLTPSFDIVVTFE